MSNRATLRAQRLLPAYHSGRLSTRRTAWLEGRLAADPGLRRESDALRRLAERLRAGDPSTPPAPAETLRLQARLRQELAAQPAAPGRRPLPALALGAALFALGLVAGHATLPRPTTTEVVRERQVAVAVPVPYAVPVRVEVPVEKRVEVPVTRVVTKVVPQVRVVYRDRGSAPVERVVTAERPSPVPIRVVDPRVRRTEVAVLPSGDRPATVDF